MGWIGWILGDLWVLGICGFWGLGAGLPLGLTSYKVGGGGVMNHCYPHCKEDWPEEWTCFEGGEGEGWGEMGLGLGLGVGGWEDGLREDERESLKGFPKYLKVAEALRRKG